LLEVAVAGRMMLLALAQEDIELEPVLQ